MGPLDKWLKSASASAPAELDHANRPPPSKRRRVTLRSAGQFRTDELIEAVRKNRVLWSREARGFYSPAARDAAYKRVAASLNRLFPDLPPWNKEEVESHWRLIVQTQFACLQEHGKKGAATHCRFPQWCRFDKVSFLNGGLSACSDWQTFIPRFYFRGSVYLND